MDTQYYRSQIAWLQKEIDILRDHIDHFSPAGGFSAEAFVASIVGGQVTSHTEQADVKLPSGLCLEVKYSRLNRPNPVSPTLRWSWAHVFGNSGNKKYESLILVGKQDSRFVDAYKDPLSPYVIFDVPYSAVSSLARNGLIAATTKPTWNSTTRGLLFSKFEVSRRELADRYGNTEFGISTNSRK